MEEILTFNTASLVSTPLEMRFNDTVLSHGTGFYYESHGDLYLVTNWHNFTGRNYRTKRLLSKYGGVPNKITCKFFQKRGDEYFFSNYILDLYNEKTNAPLWLVHPKLNNKVDIVVLKIVGINGNQYMPINSKELEFEKFSIQIGSEVFILGFPNSIRQNGVFPIWKRGTIATEPEFDYENEPTILVDSGTITGMSGSPVIVQKPKLFIDNNKGIGIKYIKSFLGIYSGRLSEKSKKDSQLGIVWKAYLIEEIINGMTIDK